MKQLEKWNVVLVYLIALVYLGYVPVQGDFSGIIIAYSFVFFAYIIIVFRYIELYSFRSLLALALLSRFILLFSFPNLSDDVYRFIWDGRCMHAGISPFEYLPSELVGTVQGLDQNLLEKLNSPSYYSIYPPLGQLVNYLATMPYIASYHGSAIVMKSFLFLAEIGTILMGVKLLGLLKQPKKNIFIYALNPLIIIELIGNIHHEALMVFFIVLFIYYLLKDQHNLSSLYLSGAVMSKILPVMFAPLLLFHLKDWKKVVRFGSISTLALLISFTPIVDFRILENLLQSIGLYVDKFEFNASIYYCLRWIGYQIKGFNTIHIVGPILSYLTVSIICILAWRYGKTKKTAQDFISYLLFSFTIYLFLATIVHPWYLSMPLILCTFTRFRFPVLWSFLIFWTYWNYDGGMYTEKMWVVGIEYMVVIGIFAFEFFYRRGRRSLAECSSGVERSGDLQLNIKKVIDH